MKKRLLVCDMDHTLLDESSRLSRENLEAIRAHRSPEIRQEKSLRGYLYRADKASRNCLACPAEPACDWPKEKKNLEITD